MNRKIQAFFDGHAPNWDGMIPPECVARLRDMMGLLDIAEGDRVLDVGTGTGVLLELLAPRVGAGGCVAAIDLSIEMLRIANSKHATGTCLQADALALPFPEPCFDWAICYSVFPHFNDQREALRQLSSVIEPRGHLVVCHSQSRDAINELHRNVGDVVGGHCLPEDEEMRAMIRQAGLRLVRFDSLDDRYLVLAVRDA